MYVSPVTQMISLNGRAVRMVAGVERPLPEALVPVALLQGVVHAGGAARAPGAPVPAEEALSVEDVAAAIRALMESGDAKAFGVTGEPKLAAITKQLGAKVTDALRDEAWAIVKAEA